MLKNDIKKRVIFIVYDLMNNRQVRLFLKDDLELSFTSDVNYAKIFYNNESYKRNYYKLLYYGYDVDSLVFNDIYDILEKEQKNGLLSSDSRSSKRYKIKW